MTNSHVTGSLAMVQPAWHYVSSSNDHRRGELYQTSLMSALIARIYEGEATYGQIRKYGDFGVGTFDDLDGEMIGFDGTFYQLRSDGSARPVTGDQKTPCLPISGRGELLIEVRKLHRILHRLPESGAYWELLAVPWWVNRSNLRRKVKAAGSEACKEWLAHDRARTLSRA